jgi:trehalose/maltose transport system substrate-binding protein
MMVLARRSISPSDVRDRTHARTTASRSVGPVLLVILLAGCTSPSIQEPVTLTLLEEWTNKTFNQGRQQELQQFTRDTGIQVKLLPSPESAREKLALWQELLRTGASGPDVYGIDVIWPGILHEDFIDLKPYFANDIAAHFPAIAASYTVENKLVALPYRADIGLLFYRTDLLQQYGYREPPKKWDELEAMAARIQAGERAKGRKQFWGFVWQGAAEEALTCNALEWQASEGGGHIIEEDKTISVNNPDAIRAWQRAARWVGSISPPSVIGYQESDALNVWLAGDAAFMRNWPTALVDSGAAGSSVRSRFETTVLPDGKAHGVGTLGGAGLAVSRRSAHRREALELVRYLSSKEVQLKRSRLLAEPPTLWDLYESPALLESNPRFVPLRHAFQTGTVSRPSAVTGHKYPDVTDAYIRVVHSVLTGDTRAGDAAAALERELMGITGFTSGRPLERSMPVITR